MGLHLALFCLKVYQTFCPRWFPKPILLLDIKKSQGGQFLSGFHLSAWVSNFRRVEFLSSSQVIFELFYFEVKADFHIGAKALKGMKMAEQFQKTLICHTL